MPAPTPSEVRAELATRLVDRARAGDAAAYGELVRRYRARIVALALHLTGSASEAEDIAQDVFVAAYRELAGFEGRSAFFTWVYRMAVNRSLNARRARARRREDAIDDPRLERALAVDAGDDPARATELRRTYRRLLDALDRLPPDMRAAVVLVALQGLSHAEAAVVQRCPVGTVAWRIHEARARLRAAVEPPPARAPGRPPHPAPVPRIADPDERLATEVRGWPIARPLPGR